MEGVFSGSCNTLHRKLVDKTRTLRCCRGSFHPVLPGVGSSRASWFTSRQRCAAQPRSAPISPAPLSARTALVSLLMLSRAPVCFSDDSEICVLTRACHRINAENGSRRDFHCLLIPLASCFGWMCVQEWRISVPDEDRAVHR